MQELEGILYRAKRGAEGARLRRWATVPAVAAINGVRLGGVAVLGGEEVRSQRVGVRALVGRWSGAGKPGKRRMGAGGGAAVGGRGRPAGGGRRARQVGPTCRREGERGEGRGAGRGGRAGPRGDGPENWAATGKNKNRKKKEGRWAGPERGEGREFVLFFLNPFSNQYFQHF
jgi:hypothetical protein